MQLEVQISGLQKEGVSRLKQRMKEVCLDFLNFNFKDRIKKNYIYSKYSLWLWDLLVNDEVIFLSQLGIHADNPSEFLTQAKKIVTGHKELQGQLTTLQGQVSSLEMEKNKLMVSPYIVSTAGRMMFQSSQEFS